jgi:hypothetical protein
MKHFTKRNKTLYKKRATKRKTFKRKGGIGFFGKKENKINYFDKNTLNNTEDDDFEKIMTEEINKFKKDYNEDASLSEINQILCIFLEQKIKTDLGKFIDIKNNYKDALMNYAKKTNDKKIISQIIDTINTNKVSEWLKIPIPSDEQDLLAKYSDLDKIIKEFNAIYNYGYKNNMGKIYNLFINNGLEVPPVKKENQMMAFPIKGKDYRDYLNKAFPISKELSIPYTDIPYTENPMNQQTAKKMI